MSDTTQLSKEIAGGAELLSVSEAARRLRTRFETVLRWIIAGRPAGETVVRLEAIPWGRNGHVTTIAAIERFLSRIQCSQDNTPPLRSPTQAERDVDAAMKRLGV